MSKHTPYLPSPETVAYLKEVWGKYVDPSDVEFLESVVTRANQDGSDQVHKVTELCEADSSKCTPWQMHQLKKRIRELVWSLRISAYRQRFVVILCAQRKQHPKYQIPNIGNLLPPQACRVESLTCYGLGYAEARNHLVKAALSKPDPTHVLFLDDDVLIPNDAIEQLLESMARTGIRIMGGIYCKKTGTAESVVTTSADDPELVYGNASVPPVQGATEPVLVGCTGLGFTMVEASVFREMPEPWFEFIKMVGSDRITVGEDSLFVQRAAAGGVRSAVIPGIVGVHVDFATGRHFGPDWVVDPATQRIRAELVERYTQFPPDLTLPELLAEDVHDLFGKNEKIREVLSKGAA